MDSLILFAVFFGIAATYPLRSLMLIERDSHEGPLRSSLEKRRVRFAASGHVQAVSLFDWIRRIFGVYEVNELDEWVVHERREQVERFSCPHCLSWWTSLPFSLGLVLWKFGFSPSAFIWWLPSNFFIAVVSQICYRYLWD